jgi:hypothetical protein
VVSLVTATFVLGDIRGMSVCFCMVCLRMNYVCGCDLVKIFRVLDADVLAECVINFP